MKFLPKRNYALLAASLVLLLFVSWGHVNSSDNDVKAPQFVQAFPGLVEIVQPDGTELTIQKAGDEAINYTYTDDGYTLLPDEQSVYFYAEIDNKGDLVRSKYKAKKKSKRTKQEEKFLDKIRKKLEYSEKQKKDKKNKFKKTNKTQGLANVQFGPIDEAFPPTGNRKMLVILSNFSDKSFVKSNNDFNNIMNVGTTSFKAYYQDNSYNALNVTTTVVGPYNISMTMSSADSNTRSYIAQCVDAAEADGVDFSEFDNNNDGTMDALYVIHAGYGEEAGAPSYTIWSHSWNLSTYARNYDGVYIDSYATSPELRNASGSTITAIGVIAHEFGHNMGAPDYYDTDGSSSGGTAWDLKKWDVMAGGSWNDSGDTPAQHNMYTKWQFGWANPTVISSAASLSLNNTAEYNEAYRINTTTSNEFFILENRQQVGWDAALPGSGLLIFHIDGNFIDGLSSNTVNANPSHQGCDIEEADNLRSTANYGGDPFPGTANKTSFTDTTTPNSKSWAGANTNKPVTAISEASGVISFDFMGGSSTPTITADFTFVTNALAVNFTDTSTASGTSISTWSWNFGDSSTSTQQNPTHTYASAGTYSVSLTVSDGAGTSDSISKNVTVTDGGLVYCTTSAGSQQYEWIAGVQVGTLNNTSGASGYTDYTHLSVTLTQNDSVNLTLTPGFSGSSYTEYWKIWIDYNQDGDFEDTGENVFSGSGSSNVTGSFTVPGSATTGTTRMRVSMSYGGNPPTCGTFAEGEAEDYSVEIQGTVVNPPVANFTASSTTITTGQSVNFTDTSTNDPTSWSWSFTGGTPSSSTSQNPTITYNTAGTYSVTLTATNSAGSDDETKTNYITVEDPIITYCTSSGTNQNYEWIAGVQVGSINNSSGASGYSDFTAQSANLTKGASVSLSLTPGFASGSYTEYWRIWIDYNQDGDFDDAGENVYSGSGSSTVSGSFTVSTSASTGTTRMRVSMQYSSYPSSCGSFTYGEVEDYTVNIQ